MSIKPRTASLVIYQGDDLEQLAELRQAAEVARRRVKQAQGRSLRIGDDAPTAEAEESAYDEFVAEAAERAETLVVQAIGRKRFRDLLAEHPARKVKVTDEDGTREEAHEDDADFGVNVETFPDALLTYRDGDVRTITAPEFPTAKACRDFLDNDLSDGDYESLWQTAYWLNRNPVVDPKATRYSTASPRSDET